jgi:protein SCO1
MSSWPFPVVIISILISTIAFFIAILLVPSGDSTASAFATDFKRWCFNYDPLTGSMEWGYLYMYLVQPLIIGAVIFGVWREPLKELKEIGWAHALPHALSGIGLVVILALLLPYVGSSNDYSSGDIPFEPDRLRTSFMAPPFEMVDQDSTRRALIPTEQKITIVTGIYTSCGETCPLIVQQIYRVMSRLSDEDKSHIRIFALTLDPETDTPAMMKAMLTAHGVDQNFFKGLTGAPEYVDPILGAYQFAKARNPETNILDHVNLINVVDPEGRLAFRFTLGNSQEVWLEQSIRYLIKESF